MRIRYVVVMATVGLIAGAGWIAAQDSTPDEAVLYGLGKAGTHMRSYQLALKAYMIDFNTLPPSTTEPGRAQHGSKIPEGIPQFRGAEIRNPAIPTGSLTTPVSYLNMYPVQKIGTQEHPYAYYSTGTTYLIWAPGPDGQYETDWNRFDPDTPQQSPEFHAAYSYDPTNGYVSRGDLWFSPTDNATVLTKFSATPREADTRRRQNPQGSIMERIIAATENSTPPGKYESAVQSMRALATGLETYYIDNSAYPLHTTDTERQAGPNPLPDGIPTFHKAVAPVYRIQRQGDDNTTTQMATTLSSLTTPVAYLNEMLEDPYMQAPSPFAYISRGNTWMVWSPGPDGKYDIDAEALSSKPEWPAPGFLVKYRYDPTNGAESRGDILREK